MAYHCAIGLKAECDGCGNCMPEVIVGKCAQCHESILAGEVIYDLDSLTLHEDCLMDFMYAYRKTADIQDTGTK